MNALSCSLFLCVMSHPALSFHQRLAQSKPILLDFSYCLHSLPYLRGPLLSPVSRVLTFAFTSASLKARGLRRPRKALAQSRLPPSSPPAPVLGTTDNRLVELTPAFSTMAYSAYSSSNTRKKTPREAELSAFPKFEEEFSAHPNLDYIFSCSVCGDTFSEVYKGPNSTVQGLSDGRNPRERIVTRMYVGSCAHVICIKHLGDGGGKCMFAISTAARRTPAYWANCCRARVPSRRCAEFAVPSVHCRGHWRRATGTLLSARLSSQQP